MRILIVEDEAKTAAYLSKGLTEHGYVVDVASNGIEGLHLATSGPYDLILLDVMLPGLDGWGVLDGIRRQRQTPVLFLSARDEVSDRVKGLELGADDYLVKPFAFSELLARIRTVLRRTQAHPVASDSAAPRAFRFCEWELNLRTRRLNSTAGPVELTHTEYDLLMAFLGAPQRILTREQLLELIRGDDCEVFDRSIDVQILRLRRKIEADPSRPQLIKTERGLGYFFSAKVETVA